jgi:hypothetical protein
VSMRDSMPPTLSNRLPHPQPALLHRPVTRRLPGGEERPDREASGAPRGRQGDRARPRAHPSLIRSPGEEQRMRESRADRRKRERIGPVTEDDALKTQIYLLRDIRTIVGWLLFLQLAGIVATVIAVAASS